MSSMHRRTIFETLGRNPIHPFPARMAPGIALEVLAESETPLRVLDPMAGSGTVLAVARSKGHRAFGVDMDPLAVLLSKAWTTSVDHEAVTESGAAVLGRAKKIADSLSSAQSYPIGSDDETRRFIRYWFDVNSRRQLTALSVSIARIRDERVRNALWCAFSRLIITKQAGASLAMDLSHSRPHKVFEIAPIKPFDKFSNAIGTVVENSVQRGERGIGPPSMVNEGDARMLPNPTGSIDLVLTSPPYLNAIDYIRCSKFSLVWMGYTIEELRALRGRSIGAEKSCEEALADPQVRGVINDLRLRPELPTKCHGMLAKYIADMVLALKEVSRVLCHGGRAVYVVGDSSVRGTFVRNSLVVVRAAELNGLELDRRRWRTLPENRRYLPPPTSRKKSEQLDSRMRREVILTFEKVA